MGDFQDSQQISKRPNQPFPTPQIDPTWDQLKPLPTHEKCCEYLNMDLIFLILFRLHSTNSKSELVEKADCELPVQAQKDDCDAKLDSPLPSLSLSPTSLAGEDCSILTPSCCKSALMCKKENAKGDWKKLHQDDEDEDGITFDVSTT